MADDDLQAGRSKVPAVRFVPEVSGLRDERWEYQQARGRQHDPAAGHGY